MGLQNIFEMAKADRYTADGREELAKAREADDEDRTYNIGEISQKTGLQKTANGWVKPRAESNTAASKSPEASFKSTKPAGTIEKGKVFIDRFGGSESLKVDEVGSDGSFSYTITKSDGSKAGGKAANEKELRHILETSGYGEKKGDSEKEKASSEAPKMTPEQRKKWEDKAANSSETTASLRNQIRAFEKDPVTNPHSKEIVDIYKKEIAKRESNPNYRPEKLYDSAPRALTGDCKVRVRK